MVHSPSSPARLTLTLALTLASLPMLAQAGGPPIQIQPEQARALGVRVAPAAAAQAATARYPAQVVLPSAAQQVVTAPLPALVVELRVNAGDPVRAGDVVAVLRSPQAQELQRESLTADSQAQLAADVRARDEALFAEGLIALSRVEASRAQAHQAQLLRDERRRALADAGLRAAGGTLALRAPLGGVVLERLASVGQRVDASTALLRVGSVARLWLELQVPVRDLSGVALGDLVAVPGVAAKARVTALGHSVDSATQTVMVRAELPGTPALRVGQSVEVMLERPATDALQLPSGSLLTDAGQSAVFVQSAAGRFERVAVQVLSRQGAQSTVRGLPAGSQVVVEGVSSLKSILATRQP